MSSSLRDDLASLKIERTRSKPVRGRNDAKAPLPSAEDGGPLLRVRKRRRGGFGMALLSLLVWAVPLGLLAGGSYYGYQQYLKVKPRREIVVTVVQKMTAGEVEKLLSAKGYIHSRYQADVGARMAGRVQDVRVEEGDKVEKGDVLAILEHNDLDAMLAAREATVQRSKAELKEAIASRDEKKRRLERAKKLIAARSMNIEEYDDATCQAEMTAARVEQIQASIALQQANVKEIQETIENMHIRAPFPGTVLSKDAEIGETITPGGMGAASGRGSVVVLADLNTLEVETDIAESLLSRVSIGQPAEISVSAVPDRRYPGRVRQIVPLGDRAKGTIKVYVEITKADEKLFPELVATVHFLPPDSQQGQQQSKPEVFVPKDILVEEQGHTYVWVVTPNDELQKVVVEVVVTNDSLARVESGLTGGERAVMKPDAALQAGEKVKVAE